MPTIDRTAPLAARRPPGSRPPRGTAAPPTALLGLPRTYWLLWVGTLVNRLGGAVFPFLSLYLTQQRGVGARTAGLVIAAYAAGGMIAGPVGGAMADRLGRRPTLLTGTSLAALCMLALGLARSTVTVIAVAPLLGFFTDLCRPALQAAVADIVPPQDRTRAYGLLYWAINLGFSGAAVFAGALAETSFTLLFAVDAATTLAFGLLVVLGVPETRPAAHAPTAAGPGMTPLRDRAFLAFVLVQLPVLLTFQQTVVALPLDMRAHGISAPDIGKLLALNGLVIIAFQPLFLRIAPRLTRARLLTAGAALTGLGFGVGAFAGGVPVYGAGIVVWTLGEIAFSTATPALIADVSPVHQRGGYLGAYQLVWGVAGVAAPALGSLVLQHLGAAVLWVGCLLACLFAGALHATITAGWAARRGGR